MPIDIKQIASALNLSSSQKQAIGQMTSGAEIKSFLERSGIRIPSDIKSSLTGAAGQALSGMADKGRVATNGAQQLGRDAARGASRHVENVGSATRSGAHQVQQAVQGVLDSTDLDEQVMHGLSDMAKQVGGIFGRKQ